MNTPAIPIRNIYYMLAYAWNHLQDAKQINLDAVSGDNLFDLLGHVLNKSILHLSRRGFELGYQSQTELLAGVKGRINFTRTIRGFHHHNGKTVSSFDELTPDTLANRIIKSTLTILIRQKTLSSNIREEARSIRTKMAEISEIHLMPLHFQQIRVGANNSYYKFIISICKMINDNVIVNKQDGSYRFYDFVRDERSMSLLYQDFLYHFCKRELKDINTKRSYLKWDAVSATDPSLSFLPRMETDITLSKSDKSLIIDAKYYKNIFTARKGTNKFQSGNLYQMLNYLIAQKSASSGQVSGLLIYPQVGESVKHLYKINDFDVGICTINLDQEWEKIRFDLLSVINESIN